MKTAFITGAAQGIGLAIARQFAREGYQVGLFDVNAARCEDLLSYPEFKHAIAGFCDVRDSTSINEAVSTFAQATGGQLHVLVNNAGVLSGGEIMTHSESQIRAMVDVNVTGLTMVSCAAHPLLKATEGAMVINLCSASSIHGIPLLAVYSATKFYVDGLTQALNLEWEDDDIYVTCIKPPVIDTEMGRSLDPRHIENMTWEMKPDDVAAGVRYLAGPESSWVTGQSFAIEGGNELRKGPDMAEMVKQIYGDEAFEKVKAGIAPFD